MSFNEFLKDEPIYQVRRLSLREKKLLIKFEVVANFNDRKMALDYVDRLFNEEFEDDRFYQIKRVKRIWS